MALENLVAYVVVLGLPLWLIAEEVMHRFVSDAKPQEAAGAPAKGGASAERRAPEGAPVHATSV